MSIYSILSPDECERWLEIFHRDVYADWLDALQWLEFEDFMVRHQYRLLEEWESTGWEELAGYDEEMEEPGYLLEVDDEEAD